MAVERSYNGCEGFPRIGPFSRKYDAMEPTAPSSANSSGQVADPNIMFIFGASGDLTKRKLIPALINLKSDHLLSDQFAVLGMARRPMSDEEFRRKLEADLENTPTFENRDGWNWLRERLYYSAGDLNDIEAYQRAKKRLAEIRQSHGIADNLLHYLATSPEHFGEAATQLENAGLTQQENGTWRRVIIEKPFGHDVESARALNRALHQVLEENQIYRIDHYLGKETVQNIMVLRFANGIFEPLWNRRYIDHVQITVAEELGVESRGGYYDQSGALRDMVPNHLFQLVTLIAMEPPASTDADAIRDEQIKVVRVLKPLVENDVRRNVIRGQYQPGNVKGKPVPGYRSETQVDPQSRTETFVAMRLDIENWRWAGVPFYLRTGKRLNRRGTEIVIQFRRAPHMLFRHTAIDTCMPNQLLLSIQPQEGVSLRFGVKVPGPVVKLGVMNMDFNYAESFEEKPSTGYERLLYDCMLGDPTLFQRVDMVERSWRAMEPIQHFWQSAATDGLYPYPAGSHGPKEADELLARDGRQWRESDRCDCE